MSIITTTAIVAATALVGAFAAGPFMSKSIQTAIQIDAPAETVWSVLADGKSYDQWNPFVKRMEGDLIVGDQLAVTVQGEGASPMDFAPTVLVSDTGKELRWVGKLGVRGIFDGEHHFILEELQDGSTRFVHGETFTGMLAYVLYPLIGESTEAGFKAMNVALKERAEAQS